MFFWPCIMNWLYINYQLDALIIIDVEYIYVFVWWGGLQTKSMTSQRNRATHKMADMRCYGNVMTTTWWRLYVTMETLWQQQDVIDVFYIFNSTVVDWTCFTQNLWYAYLFCECWYLQIITHTWLHLVNIMVYTDERVEVTFSRNYTILMQENTRYSL